MIGAGNIGGLKSSWNCGYFNKNKKRLAWIEQEGAITDGYMSVPQKLQKLQKFWGHHRWL